MNAYHAASSTTSVAASVPTRAMPRSGSRERAPQQTINAATPASTPSAMRLGIFVYSSQGSVMLGALTQLLPGSSESGITVTMIASAADATAIGAARSFVPLDETNSASSSGPTANRYRSWILGTGLITIVCRAAASTYTAATQTASTASQSRRRSALRSRHPLSNATAGAKPTPTPSATTSAIITRDIGPSGGTIAPSSSSV